MNTDRVFRGSILALYDEHLGLLIFAPYADDLASRLAGLGHDRTLETAAGTASGVTRALVTSLPENASPSWQRTSNQPMLDRAFELVGYPRE